MVSLCSSSSSWKRLNTFSRFFTGHCDQTRWASRARSNAVSMSPGVDCGRVVITSPVYTSVSFHTPPPVETTCAVIRSSSSSLMEAGRSRLVLVMSSPCSRIQDEVGGLLPDHDRWRVGVAAGDGRHDRGVHDPEALDAPHPQVRADDGALVHAHPAGADAVVDRCRPVQDLATQVLAG